MINQPAPFPSGGVAIDAGRRNAVLRNTYWLLSLSMVPTVLGAWLGVQFNLLGSLGPGISMLVFFAGAFGLMFMVEKNKESGAGVAWLLAFTFFMGIFLSRLLGHVLGFRNGTSLVMGAFGGTAAIFFAMATLASTIKRDLSGMGKFLTVGALVVIVAMVANIFIQSGPLMLALLVLCLGIFSAFMLYDVKRIIDGGETNYISATMALYLNLYNVFSSLLSILGIAGGERD